MYILRFFRLKLSQAALDGDTFIQKTQDSSNIVKKSFPIGDYAPAWGIADRWRNKGKNIGGDWYCHLTFDVPFTFSLILYFLGFFNLYIRSLDVSIHQPLCTVTERGMTVNCFKLVTECKDSPKTEAVLLSMQHNDIHDLKKIL